MNQPLHLKGKSIFISIKWAALKVSRELGICKPSNLARHCDEIRSTHLVIVMGLGWLGLPRELEQGQLF